MSFSGLEKLAPDRMGYPIPPMPPEVRALFAEKERQERRLRAGLPAHALSVADDATFEAWCKQHDTRTLEEFVEQNGEPGRP